MSCLILLITCSYSECIVSNPKEKRSLNIVNLCSFKIWVGIYGYISGVQYGPNNGGFELDSNNEEILSISSSWYAGRIWGRTNCYNDSNGYFRCDTGSCDGVDNDYSRNGGCCLNNKCIDGESPVSKIELSLSSTTNDYYNLSLVDGYNLPIKIEVSDFNFACGINNDSIYNCGNITINKHMYKGAQATYQCQNADYTITFCPSSNQKSMSSNDNNNTKFNSFGYFGPIAAFMTFGIMVGLVALKIKAATLCES